MAGNTFDATKWDVTIGGNAIPDDDVMAFVIDSDLNQPDMAVVVLNNSTNDYTGKCNHGDALEIRVDGKNNTVFKGEVGGLEPQYKASGETKLVVRAFGPLHKFLRGKKSKTFQNMSDKDILQQVLGMSPDWKGPEITHKHVYQHNQTDLEFARIRAARLGCNIWIEDGKLLVKRPELDKDSGIDFKIFREASDTEHRLRSFSPKMSSASIVKSVTVRGWNPESKELYEGKATAQASPLGKSDASKSAGDNAADETFAVDHPIWSKEEATALAEARLQEHQLAYISGEAEAVGNPDYKPGIVVSITVTPNGTDKFNGKYFVKGTTHRYSHSSGSGSSSDSGYITSLRVARDAETQ